MVAHTGEPTVTSDGISVANPEDFAHSADSVQAEPIGEVVGYGISVGYINVNR